jgi:hypothetical protein
MSSDGSSSISSSSSPSVSPQHGYNRKEYLFEFDHTFDHNDFNVEAAKIVKRGDDSWGYKKGNLPNSVEFTNTTRTRLEVPKEMLSRLLMKDEIVVAEFDAYEVNRHFSNKQIILYSIFTCGIFAVYYFVIVPLLYYLLCCFCDANTARISRYQFNVYIIFNQYMQSCYL